MLTTAITTFVTLLVLFVVMAIVVFTEQRRNRRLFLTRFRSHLDGKMHSFHTWCDDTWNHFTRYIVQLGWYYSLHSLLKTLLRVLVSVYTYIEDMFERNRLKTKQLRSERRNRTKKESHLTKMADHKVETALTPEQQRKLRKDKLENDH